MARYRTAFSMIVFGMLSACAVGPDFQAPVPPVSSADVFARSEATDKGQLLAPSNDEFWRNFNDPMLTKLIDVALSANHELHAALANYDAANALLREYKFNQYPVVTGSAEAGHQRVSTGQSYGYPRSTDVFSTGINASWEIDLFGRVRRSVESQRAETAARASDLHAVQVAIVGQVATSYVRMRGTQERLRVAKANVANQQEALRVVMDRLGVGRGTEYDVSRARALLEATKARIAPLEAQVGIDQHRLAVLTGRLPGSLISTLGDPAPLPALAVAVDPGTPADLLRRRPDIMAAEQRLHAATARTGVATADLFPRLTLGAMLGTYSFDASSLFAGRSESNFVVLGIDWSFLDVGRVRSRIEASSAQARGYLSQYQDTVLRALEETENALIRVSRTRQEAEHLEAAALESDKSARLARSRFSVGAIELFELLDVERTLLQAQDAYADSQTRSAIATVSLYTALAGGWPQRGSL